MKRALALYLPYLSTERQCGLPIDNCQLPIVTVAPHGQTLRVVHVNAAAEALRLRRGQTLAEARALVLGLRSCDDDPLADRKQLESLAISAQCFSPTVHIEGEDTLLLDVTGCGRLFAGEANLLRSALKGIHARGFTVRGAVADTPGAAWAMAHAHREPAFISEPGLAAADLAPLPVWSLRVDERTVESLRLVGVETIGSLLHLPRSSLASRFGDNVLDRIDQALGDLPEVLTPYAPRPLISTRLEWGTPIAQWDLLHEAVRRAVHQFCNDLARRVSGVRQIMVTFYCPGMASDHGTVTQPITIEVSLSRPTRSAKHLLTLLQVQLEQLRLPAGADALMVWAREVEAFDDPQCELFETRTVDARALSDLLDRVAVRLGAEAVVRPRPVNDHQPECAFRYESIVNGPYSNNHSTLTPSLSLEGRGGQTSPRPLRLLARPLRIVAMSIVPDGPPIAFQYHGKQHAIAQTIGPERIETGWWRGPHVQRDYYRVATADGLCCWLFRDRGHDQWFLHGWFD